MNLQRHLAVESDNVVEDSPEYIEALAKQQPYLEAWAAYDFDKTIAKFDRWGGCLQLGEPITPMIDHLKETAKRMKVKIFTARVLIKTIALTKRYEKPSRHGVKHILVKCLRSPTSKILPCVNCTMTALTM